MVGGRKARGIVGSAIIAGVVLAGGVAPTTASPVDRGPDPRCGSGSSAAELSEVTAPLPGEPVDADPHPAPTGAAAPGGSVQQQIGVTILGGPLELRDPQPTVVLTPTGPGMLTGALGPVTVVDARGTHAGWEVRWDVASLTAGPAAAPVEGAEVTVEPVGVHPVHGFPAGLEAGPACTDVGALASAAPGSGGGTFEIGALVTVTLPPGVDADVGTVTLDLTVG